MRRLLFVVLFPLVLTACTPAETAATEPNPAPIETTTTPEAAPGLMHSVYFWLNDDVDAAGHEEFRAAAQALADVPSVQRLYVGPAADTEEPGITDNTFDLALIVWYKNRADYDAYQTDPLHVAFVESQKDKFAKVKVMDNLLY